MRKLLRRGVVACNTVALSPASDCGPQRGGSGALKNPRRKTQREKAADVPITPEDFAIMRNVPYREAVGSLTHLARCTRPDISFAAQHLARFNQKPGPKHWKAVRDVLHYLKGSSEQWLTYGGEVKKLAGYSDADGSMAEDRKAVSGYAFVINGGAVSWSSKSQEIVSLSTAESELVANTHAAKEGMWYSTFLLQVFDIDIKPLTLFCDNQAAIALTKDHQFHVRTKHIDIRYHFVRWVVESGAIKVAYCPTDEMIADVLTKALPNHKTKHFAALLGLRPD
ncbi:hypothetical protein ONZ45_g19461 [Pleurotus djamor]|nr:hypothetical protein ONZ45_g19461 [Pleurotus djamor]